jgi:hypothetical protein
MEKKDQAPQKKLLITELDDRYEFGVLIEPDPGSTNDGCKNTKDCRGTDNTNGCTNSGTCFR